MCHYHLLEASTDHPPGQTKMTLNSRILWRTWDAHCQQTFANGLKNQLVRKKTLFNWNWSKKISFEFFAPNTATADTQIASLVLIFSAKIQIYLPLKTIITRFASNVVEGDFGLAWTTRQTKWTEIFHDDRIIDSWKKMQMKRVLRSSENWSSSIMSQCILSLKWISLNEVQMCNSQRMDALFRF